MNDFMQYFLAGAALGGVGCLAIAWIISRIIGNRRVRIRGRVIDVNSKCPACGHYGCTLQYVPSQNVAVGEKGAIKATDPVVMRKCNTCGAPAYENTVLEGKAWIAK